MRRGLSIFLLFILFFSALVIAEEDLPKGDSDAEKTFEELKRGFENASKKTNPWNETTTISPVWQKLIGGFFGLNLHKKSSQIPKRFLSYHHRSSLCTKNFFYITCLFF